MEEKAYICVKSRRWITAREAALRANCITGDWTLASLTDEERWNDYVIPWAAFVDPSGRKEILAHLGRKSWFQPDKLNELLRQLEA